MSSLAATQADGYYIPPDYIESGDYKKKSLNQYNQSKGHNQYLQRSVVRFELPFDGFCTKCDAIVGKGTRFNAHKAHVDNYFTTKIYEFTTRCRSCGECEFKIRTNPKEQTFDYTDGIRKKVEEFDTAEAGTGGVIDTDIGAGIHPFKNGNVVGVGSDGNENDAGLLHLLEKNAAGHRKTLTEHEHMVSLLQLNSKMGEDADANAALRASFRKDRKAKKRRLADASGKGLGLGIELSGGTDEDAINAKKAIMARRGNRDSSSNAYASEKTAFRSVRGQSIFSSSGKESKKKRNTMKGAAAGNPVKCDLNVHVAGKADAPCLKKKLLVHQSALSPVTDGASTKNERMQTESEPSALSALAACYSDSD